LHKTCGISPLTFDTLMQDGLHPTAMGHYRIAEALWPDVKRLIE
jgi:lysophospholipase L1-like esterase